MTNAQTDRRIPNYLRTHRRRIGFTQRDLARVLGYDADRGSISRHERFHSAPPLAVAIGYEIIFRVPISEIFAGLRDEIENEIEERLAELEEVLGKRSGTDRNALAIARTLMWLCERKGSDYELT
jgi:transcriptional regulator with XRE-family HTH domain